MTDDTPWLSRPELLAWVRLIGVLTTVPPAVDAQLRRDSCLNLFEYSILAGLSSSPGRSMQLSTLAQLSFGSQSRLSHAINRLVKAGWVTRRSSCETRTVEAVLTDAGFAKLAAAAPAHAREVRRLIFDVLDQEQIRQLYDICGALLTVTMPEGAELMAQSAAPGPSPAATGLSPATEHDGCGELPPGVC